MNWLPRNPTPPRHHRRNPVSDTPLSPRFSCYDYGECFGILEFILRVDSGTPGDRKHLN
ncbi:hypothetical protein HanRHA438_Chr01g0044831 [Helianthus annuus]|nr:hypothetical protein HanRHA438_Chr01g0044831 [Helianthus annuus]